MAGFATHTPRKNPSGRYRPALLVAGAFCLAIMFASASAADPLSPVNDTLERVTGTVGQTVSGAGNTINRTTDTLGDTLQTDRTLSSANQLGRDITQPVGTLTGPTSTAVPTASSGPATQSRTAVPNEYRPYDTFQPYTPDTLPRGTLARIYFKPGETTLDLSARNQVAGFASAFGQRIGNVELRGYADRSRGNDAEAGDVAMQRALAVQQALLAQGMSAGRVRASGMVNADAISASSDRVDILFDGY